MEHTMVTYTVKSQREEENVVLVRAVFEELATTQPAGFRYAVFHLPDTREFVHLYTDEGSTSGMQELPSFQAFVAGAQGRHEQPASFTRPELIGAYRMFNDPDDPTAAGKLPPVNASTAGETGAAPIDTGAVP
jgi:hypothetical protein